MTSSRETRDDDLQGNGGDDNLIGHRGSDFLDGGGGTNRNNGGSGTDTCINPAPGEEGAVSCEVAG